MLENLFLLEKLFAIFLIETLRKHPVAGTATRIATKDYKMPNNNFIIPKGMRIYIPIFAIHHDEEYYPEPEEFIPERFAQPPQPGTFLAFGDGRIIYFIASKIIPFSYKFLFSFLHG